MSDFWLKELFLRFVIIRKCGACKEILRFEERHEPLCQSCALAIRVAKTESCPVCLKSVSECSCMPRGLERSGALCLRKLYFYRPEKYPLPQNRLLLNMKRNPVRRSADLVAQELSDLIHNELSKLDIPPENTVIVSVPRSRGSRRLYGFDQSEYLGERLSLVTSIPYYPVIKRRRRAKEQKKLDRNKRFRNVRASFKLTDPSVVMGKQVILHDDVVTTGASMAACVELLRKAGAAGVFCVSIAQVPNKSIQ